MRTLRTEREKTISARNQEERCRSAGGRRHPAVGGWNAVVHQKSVLSISPTGLADGFGRGDALPAMRRIHPRKVGPRFPQGVRDSAPGSRPFRMKSQGHCPVTRTNLARDTDKRKGMPMTRAKLYLEQGGPAC